MRLGLLLIPFIVCAAVPLGAEHPVQERSSAQADRLDSAQIRKIQEEALARRIRPRPIDPVLLNEIPEQLGFDEETRENWVAKCERYRADWLHLVADASARAEQLRHAAYDWNQVRRTFEARPVSELIHLYENIATIHRVLREMESALFTDLPLFARSDRVARARSLVFRQLLDRTWRPFQITGAEVDMTHVLEELKLENELWENLESSMEQYRTAFGAASTLHAQVFDADAIASAYEVVQLGPLPQYASPPEILEEIAREREARAAEVLAQESRMRAINQRFLERLRVVLPLEKAVELLDAWRRILGGSHLAEQVMLQELTTEIASDEKLDAEESATVLLVPHEVFEQNKVLNVRIIEQGTLIDAIELEPPSADRDAQLLAMHAQHFRMHIERRNRLLVAIRTLIGILGSDIPSATERLLAFHELLNSRTEADAELANRSEERSLEIEAILAWEEEERLVLESLAQERAIEDQEPSFAENPQ